MLYVCDVMWCHVMECYVSMYGCMYVCMYICILYKSNPQRDKKCISIFGLDFAFLAFGGVL